MWNINESQNPTVRRAFTKCRNRMRLSMYRTRNPLDIDDVIYPFSFLFIPGARTQQERDKYIGFKTISTPRNVTDADGVAYLVDELDSMAYTINFIVVNTINSKEVGDAFCTYLKSTGATQLDQYTIVLTQSPYHRVQMLHQTYTQNEQTINNYYLFTNKMNDIAIARFAGCVCSHMNLFGEFNSALATALVQANQAQYETVVASFADIALQESIKQQMLETLSRVGSYGTERVIQRLQNSVHSKQADIQHYLDAISSMYTELRELQTQLLGAQHQSSNSNELTEFLTANLNNITYANLRDGYLYMRYNTPLLYWDEDVFKILRESSNGNPMRPTNRAKQQLIDDIFSTRKVTLWMDSGFRYNLSHCGFNYITMENEFNEVPAAKGLPNPHHRYYNCWGDNEPMIAQAQGKGDNVIALAQIFAAIAGINLSDNIVLRRFIEDMLSDYKFVPCLQIKDTGEFITIQEYYNRFNNQ